MPRSHKFDHAGAPLQTPGHTHRSADSMTVANIEMCACFTSRRIVRLQTKLRRKLEGCNDLQLNGITECSRSIENSPITESTPCGTRSRNLRMRSPTPCPLGQGGLTCQVAVATLAHARGGTNRHREHVHWSHRSLKAPPAGLEPAIFGLEVQRLVH